MTPRPRDRRSRHDAREAAPFIPVRYQHASAIGVIVLSLVVFFAPLIFEGKTFLGPDTVASHSWDTYLADARAEGIFPLWNPYIFCGMPGYGSLTVTGDRSFDVSWYVQNKLANTFGWILGNPPTTTVLFYYVVLGVGVYLLAFSKVRSKPAALLASLATIYSMYIVIWIITGHNTKIFAMSMYPWIFLVLDQLHERFRVWKALVLVLLFHYLFGATHVQMIYYTGIAVGVYLVTLLVTALRRKEGAVPVLRLAGVGVLAGALAFAMDADRYLSVLEYNPYSIRGSGPIVQAGAGGEGDVSGGLDYEYATNWSLAPGEMMTFLVPTWYGFGHLTYTGPLTSEPIRFNAYWGPQPFTDAAQYMGVAVLLLAVVGFLRHRKEPFVIFLGVLTVFSLLVAFGKEMPLVYDLLFHYAPGFDKFRIPSMILVLVQLSVPLLAAYGAASLFRASEQQPAPPVKKRWTRGAIIAGAMLAASVVLRGVFAEIYKGFFPLREVGGSIARQFGQVQAGVINEFYEFVVGTVVTDISIALVVVLAVTGGAVLFWNGRLRMPVFAALLIVVSVADLWRIARRTMDPQPKRNQEAIFSEPDYVAAIKRDTGRYRTLTFQNGQPPYDNTLAYWRVESAYGYQGAKMRAYQDMVDVAGLGNPLVWQLMNVKYVISNTPDTSMFLEPWYDGSVFDVYRFRYALPRTFFVRRAEKASGIRILDNIANRSFDPTDVAFVQADLPGPIDPPGPEASATITRYGIQELEATVTATGNNLLFLSETWYPVGWKATLDGAEVPIQRLNYLFRGVVVPPGTHTLRMTFEPGGFALGRTLSIGVNGVVLIGLAGIGGWTLLRKRRSGSTEASGQGS